MRVLSGNTIVRLRCNMRNFTAPGRLIGRSNDRTRLGRGLRFGMVRFGGRDGHVVLSRDHVCRSIRHTRTGRTGGATATTGGATGGRRTPVVRGRTTSAALNSVSTLTTLGTRVRGNRWSVVPVFVRGDNRIDFVALFLYAFTVPRRERRKGVQASRVEVQLYPARRPSPILVTDHRPA